MERNIEKPGGLSGLSVSEGFDSWPGDLAPDAIKRKGEWVLG